MSLYYYLPAMLYYTPSAVWQYIVLPIGKGVIGKVYNKVNAYMYPAEARDAALQEEFIEHLRSNNVRIYEVVGQTTDHNGVKTRYLILENSGQTHITYDGAGSKDYEAPPGTPVHL